MDLKAVVVEAGRLRRQMAMSGPVTGEMCAMVLRHAGWGYTEACERLGAATPALVEAWCNGDVPIPAYVAAHLRTVVDILAGETTVLCSGQCWDRRW